MVLNVRFAAINKNDFINGEGVCVSFWVQGCPHHCKGCHNPEQWDFNSGQYKDNDIIVEEIINAITANDIQRNFSVLGGEPFAPQNIIDVCEIIFKVKQRFPNIKIYVWSGYTLEELRKMYSPKILDNIDVLIDGRFVLEERDITLKLRGSKNQRILYKGTDF